MNGLVLCGKTAEMVLEHEVLKEKSDLEPTSHQTLPTMSSFRNMSGVEWSTQIDGIVFGHLDILVGNANDIRRCDNVSFHTWMGDVPPSGISKISDPFTSGLYVASGPFLALIAARSLPLTKLAQYVMYLCGAYCLYQREPLKTRKPLTTKEEIETMLHSIRGTMGWKRLSRILPFCAEGVRSPPEANFFAVSTFPRELYGYQFPKPAVNEDIPVEPEYRTLAGSSVIEVDFVWEDAQLIVEYNGADTHEGGVTSLDITQQTILRAQGYEVVFITKEQFGNARLLDLIMLHLAEKIGIDPSNGWPETEHVQELIDCLRKDDQYSASTAYLKAQKRWIRKVE